MFTEPNKLSMGVALLVVIDAADEVVVAALLDLPVPVTEVGAATVVVAVTLGVAVGATVLLLLTIVSTLLAVVVVVAARVAAAGAAVVTAVGTVKGVGLLPNEAPKPPKLKVELPPPMLLPALLPKPAKLKGLAAGSVLTAEPLGAEVLAGSAAATAVAVRSTGGSISFLASTGFTVTSLGGVGDGLGLIDSTFILPKPTKGEGAGAAPDCDLVVPLSSPKGSMGLTPPKLKGAPPPAPKNDALGCTASPVLTVVVVAVDAVVLTNGLLWLKLKGADTGAKAGAMAGMFCVFSPAATADGLEAVGLASCVGAAGTTCVDLWATAGLARVVAVVAAAAAAASFCFLRSALRFVSRITSDLSPTRSGLCGLMMCTWCCCSSWRILCSFCCESLARFESTAWFKVMESMESAKVSMLWWNQ